MKESLTEVFLKCFRVILLANPVRTRSALSCQYQHSQGFCFYVINVWLHAKLLECIYMLKGHCLMAGTLPIYGPQADILFYLLIVLDLKLLSVVYARRSLWILV